MNTDTYCLICGEKLDNKKHDGSVHLNCCRKFFGTDHLPEICLSDEIIEQLAVKSSAAGITVPGVQKKLSLHLEGKKEGSSRLTLIGYPAGYILKPQSEEYAMLPEAEMLVMSMAEKVGISAVPHALICMADGRMAYITKRADRNGSEKIAMEDFCQLSGRLTEDKYRGSYEQCARIIKKYSSRPGLDLSEFYYRLIFCFVTGNSDMHMKNFSLINNFQDNSWILSPAYDLLPVNLILPADEDETALTLNGKKRHLRRSDFLKFAAAAGISIKAAGQLIEHLSANKDLLLEMTETSFLSTQLKADLSALIIRRCSALCS